VVNFDALAQVLREEQQGWRRACEDWAPSAVRVCSWVVCCSVGRVVSASKVCSMFEIALLRRRDRSVPMVCSPTWVLLAERACCPLRQRDMDVARGVAHSARLSALPAAVLFSFSAPCLLPPLLPPPLPRLWLALRIPTCFLLRDGEPCWLVRLILRLQTRRTAGPLPALTCRCFLLRSGCTFNCSLPPRPCVCRSARWNCGEEGAGREGRSVRTSNNRQRRRAVTASVS
jgi:hypothetical protein